MTYGTTAIFSRTPIIKNRPFDVLTPNGFGIVSNQNVALASPHRLSRLLGSLETSRDIAIEQLRQAVVAVLQGNQVPIQSLRDIVDLMRKNETSFPHFRNSDTYKLFEPPVFENKKEANGYWF